MAFPSQLPTAHLLEDVDQICEDAGPDMNWMGLDFKPNLQFNQSFDSTQQTTAFDFQNGHVASSISPYSFSPLVHMPISQTGPPFKSRQSQVSDFRQYRTDDQFSGRKRLENEALERHFGPVQDPLGAYQFGVNRPAVGLTG
jgi:hypothetical protein